MLFQVLKYMELTAVGMSVHTIYTMNISRTIPATKKAQRWTINNKKMFGWVGIHVKLSQLSFTLIKKRKDTPPPVMRTVVIKMADNNREWECGEARPLCVDCWERCKVTPVFGAKLAVLSKGKHECSVQWNIVNVLAKRWNLKPRVDWHVNLYSVVIHDIPKWKPHKFLQPEEEMNER